MANPLTFMQRLVANWQTKDEWPPPHLRVHWDDIDAYRRRYDNDKGKLIQADANLAMDPHNQEIFTPVGLPRELCRFSSALLFAETPQVTSDEFQDVIDAGIEVNDFGAWAIESGVKAARDGRVAIRVIWDPDISDLSPLLTLVPEDQVVWNIRHGAFYAGGVVVFTHKDEKNDKVYYRLLEEHAKGSITRWCFKGERNKLGKRVELTEVWKWADLRPYETTGIDRPTLIPWLNDPLGESDLFGLGPLFNELNQAESLLLDRGKKSVPRLFIHKNLLDNTGRMEIESPIIVGGARTLPTLGSDPMQGIKLVQEPFYTEDHIRWNDHVTQLIVTVAGYSPETWGIQGQTANVTRAVSGYAMKLSQLRTLLNRAGKAHMALQAMGWAFATMVAMQKARAGAGLPVSKCLPKIELGDGLPPDPLDGAQEVLFLRQAMAADTAELVRTVHPTWSDDEVNAQAAHIIAEASVMSQGGSNTDGTGPTPLPATMHTVVQQAIHARQQAVAAVLERAGSGGEPNGPPV